MKKVSLILLVVLCTVAAGAQNHILSFGLRGGTVNLLEQTSQAAKGKFGPAAALDINYDYYVLYAGGIGVGLRTGASVGYARNVFSGSYSQQYVNIDYLDNEMDYNVSGDVKTVSNGCFVDIPMLATLRAGGYYLGLGLKMQSYVYSYFTQTLSNTYVEATYPKYGPTISNEMITGLVPDNVRGRVGNEDFLLANLSAGLETGYEWRMSNRAYIALSAYAFCSVWNSYTYDKERYVVKVNPITDPESPMPSVKVNDAISCLTQKMIPVEFGLKLSFGQIF